MRLPAQVMVTCQAQQELVGCTHCGRILYYSPDMDLAGAELLDHLRGELETRGITLRLAEVRGPLRKRLRAAGLEAHFGPITANTGIAPLIRKQDGQVDWTSSATALANRLRGTLRRGRGQRREGREELLRVRGQREERPRDRREG